MAIDKIEAARPSSAVQRERRKIERYSRLTLLGRRWFWRARGPNGEIVAHGEPYNSPAARDNGIRVTRDVFAVGKTVDL